MPDEVRAGWRPGDDREPGGARPLTLAECREAGPAFARLAALAANAAGVDPAALVVRTLLHLPRVASASGEVSADQVARELRRSARLLRRDTAAARGLVPDAKHELRDLVYAENADARAAERIISSLHYLRSAREGSQYHALLDPDSGLPVTICSVSPFEWKRLGNQIQEHFGFQRDRMWDVSRVYSCDVAPPNAISYLLARVRHSLARAGRDADLLVTAVDPNLGFTGASYRAANWQHWLTVRPRPYLYHSGQYATPRQLRRRFGTSSLTELRARFPGERFEQSRARLLDSLIFCCQVGGETAVIPAGSRRRLHR